MATFRYKARTGDGRIVQNNAEGDDAISVASALRRQGLLVIDVKARRTSQGAILDVFRKVGQDDIVVFTRQLATMINAGLPITRALGVLTEQTENQTFLPVIGVVRRDVEAGLALSESLRKHPTLFDRLYVEMVRAGEISGRLDAVLLRIAEQLEKDRDLRRKVKSAMTYPIVVLLLAILAASFMLLFIVPIFARMFEDLGGTLPLPTRIAMGLSDVLTGPIGLLVLLALGAAAVAFVRWKRTEGGRRIWGRWVLKIPLQIGGTVHKVALARFARTLGTLTAAGVPILQTIEITAVSSGSPVLEEALLKSRSAVREGLPMHVPLEHEPVFPAIVTRMVAVGEETGDLDGMLEKVAEFYESEVDASVRALTSVIEPLMIVVVGGIVGGIIVAMYLPMFRIFELIN